MKKRKVMQEPNLLGSLPTSAMLQSKEANLYHLCLDAPSLKAEIYLSCISASHCILKWQRAERKKALTSSYKCTVRKSSTLRT